MDPVQLAVLLVSQFEGYSPTPYQDQGGVWTIGFGRTGKDVSKDTTTTLTYETEWMKGRLEWLWKRIDHDLGRDINCNQAAAVLSLAYNIGLSGLQRSTLWHFLQDGQPGPAADRFADFVRVRTPGGSYETSKGLIARRKAERDMFVAPPPQTIA